MLNDLPMIPRGTASRQHPRAQVNLPLRLTSDKVRNPEDHSLLNVSIGGIMATAAENLDTGDNVNLEFALSDERRYALRGRVVWTTSDHVGICFLERNPGLVAAVTAMVASQRSSRNFS